MVLRQLPARRARRPEHHDRRLRPARRASASRATRGPATSCARRSTWRSSRPASARSRASIQGGPRHGRRRSSRSTRATARSWRWAPTRRSRRASSRKPISQQRYDAIFGEQAGSPLFNRAIAGGYPTGSTFKPITALAALERGPDHARHADQRPGLLKISPTQTLHNARGAVNGTISLRRALQVSSDVFFFILGRDANGAQGPGDPELGAQARPRPPRPASTCPARSRARSPTAPGARAWRRPRRPASAAARSLAAGSPTSARGRSATTSTSPSARATCRRRRCRWRSPTRRSRTAARSCARTSGSRSRTTAGACCGASRCRRRAT